MVAREHNQWNYWKSPQLQIKKTQKTNKQNPCKKSLITLKTPKGLHPETQIIIQISTLFPEFKVLKLTEAYPYCNQVVLIHNCPKKTPGFMIKPKLIKKLANNTLLAEVTKKTYPDPLLEQKSFYNHRIKTHPYNFLNFSKGVISISLPFHPR